MTSIVSVIIPVYNGASTLSLAVESLRAQSYPHWEALIINDGSTDGTVAYLEGLMDSRIKVFHQENAGVSAARNVGLSHMQGDYFCFLDADDALPKESLQSRLTVFANDTSVEFVDGKVHLMDMRMKNKVGEWSPNWKGNPLHDLIALSGRSFFGPTWMFRKIPGRKYEFMDGLTHCEDLLFYIQQSLHGGTYFFTSSAVLQYRTGNASAMKNLYGLERGYQYIHRKLGEISQISLGEQRRFGVKIRSILWKSYLRQGYFLSAIRVFFNLNLTKYKGP